MQTIFLIGRILLGGYFVYSAYNHFVNLKGLTEYAKAKNVPLPQAAVLVTGFMMLFGGVSILSGFALFFGLWFLVIFLVVVSFVMHPFWKLPKEMALRATEQINFTKNIALAGAILLILAMAMY